MLRPLCRGVNMEYRGMPFSHFGYPFIPQTPFGRNPEGTRHPQTRLWTGNCFLRFPHTAHSALARAWPTMSRRQSTTDKSAFSSDLFDKGIASLADKLVATTLQGGRQLGRAVVETIAPAPAPAVSAPEDLAPAPAPASEADDAKGKRHGKSMRHRRSKSSKQLLSSALGSASDDDMGASFSANAAYRRASATISSLSEFVEPTKPSGDEDAAAANGSALEGVGRHVYREQLFNAQMALGATRDELARMMQDREEEVAREREKRERAERDLRRAQRRHRTLPS